MNIFSTLPAAQPSHQERVAKAIESGAPRWWCQMVSVAYEQQIGVRVPGQDGLTSQRVV
jgi:hypothetical protein